MVSKAFLNGIDNYEKISDLRGCVRDTQSIRDLLIKFFGFDSENILIKHNEDVTKGQLEKGWRWLLNGAKPGDRLVFHFSGHGSYTVDKDNEPGEVDHRDELLCLHGMDWNDPSSYLLDDEIAAWTRQIPAGVQVTFLLDCCHSGTGTRFVEPQTSRAVLSDYRTAGALSLESVAKRRFRESQGEGTTRSAARTAGLAPVSSNDIDELTVLARFAPPPVEIEEAISNVGKSRTIRDAILSRGTRGSDNMNHVLWSGCRDDQTSADAHIDGAFHGAFTYYFCSTIRTLGATSDAGKVIKNLRSALRKNNFDQVPQLEPASTAGTIFGGGGKKSSEVEKEDLSDSSSSNMPLNQDELRQLSSLLQRFISASGSSSRLSTVSGKRAIVYIHGICSHKEGYSDKWWNALAKHLDGDLKAQLEACRKEVLWSKHVTSGDRGVRGEAKSIELANLQAMMHAVLEDRMSHAAGEQLAEVRSHRGDAEPMPQSIDRALFGVPGLNCIDDFMKYLVSDSIREKVVGEATRVLIPLLAEGRSIELVSHSWGTVVAYEALHQLSNSGHSGRVHNWFTVGSALAINLVAKQLRPVSGAKPHLVEHWINLDAKGDGVGGSILATGMKADQEYLNLNPVGCKPTFGIFSPSCAHSSYFNEDNHPVNRDVFAKWIQKP